MDLYSRISEIEKQIHNVQMAHSVGKISTKKAKLQIRTLNDELHALIALLPEPHKQQYNFRRTYGSA